MKEAQVVIGANFGDEGKGLFTDYLTSCSTEPVTVVRYNGGAQAGHTVEAPDGRRHIFSHFGSGSFMGAETFLSRFFAVNPLLFARERKILEDLNVTPRMAIDEAAMVTTPYDMMINQIIEDARGATRHGSCGVGFGETVERSEAAGFALCAADLARPDLADRLIHIRQHWLPQRLGQLGITTLSSQWHNRINSEEVLEGFIALSQAMLEQSKLVPGCYLSQCRSLIFEGAQGLLLDQRAAFFPHVTRSNTGLMNVVELAEEAGIEHLDVLYATRAYLTRHGAGPLPFELPEKPYEKIFDATNKPHPYQGTLRFAPLNLDLLQSSIAADLLHTKGRIATSLHLGVSCCDQLDDAGLYIHNNRQQQTTPDHLLQTLILQLAPQKLFTSYGPRRGDVREGG